MARNKPKRGQKAAKRGFNAKHLWKTASADKLPAPLEELPIHGERFLETFFWLMKQPGDIFDLPDLGGFVPEIAKEWFMFGRYIPYILTELHTKVFDELISVSRKRSRSFKMRLIKCKHSFDRFPTLLFEISEKEFPKLDHSFQMEAVVMQIPDMDPKLCDRVSNCISGGIMGIASLESNNYRPRSQQDKDEEEKDIKIKQEQKDIKVKKEGMSSFERMKNSRKSEKKVYVSIRVSQEGYEQLWNLKTVQVFHVCGIVPSYRMYESCLHPPSIAFKNQFFFDQVQGWPSNPVIQRVIANPVNPPELDYLQNLNEDQRKAVTGLVVERKGWEGLLLLQGPPGTGKTTTVASIVAMLVNQCDTSPRILVTAPSNQAVKVLAMKVAGLLKNSVGLAWIGTEKDKVVLKQAEQYFVHDFIRPPLEGIHRLIEDHKRLMVHEKIEMNGLKLELEKVCKMVEPLPSCISLIEGKEADFSADINVFMYVCDFVSVKDRIFQLFSTYQTFVNNEEETEQLLQDVCILVDRCVVALVTLDSYMIKTYGYQFESSLYENLVKIRNRHDNKKKAKLLQIEDFLEKLRFKLDSLINKGPDFRRNAVEETLHVSVFLGFCDFVNDLDNFKKLRSRYDAVLSIGEINEMLNSVKNCTKFLKRAEKNIKDFMIQRAVVVFATLVGSACGIIKKNIPKFDSVIVDEAAQALVPEISIVLSYSPRRVLLTGDHKQLPPTVLSQGAKQAGYGRSLMEILVEDNKQPCLMLTVQYRMHPDICLWPSQRYYEGKLVAAPEVQNRRSMLQDNRHLDPAFKQPMLLFDICSGEEAKNPGVCSSIYNEAEVAAIINMARYLVEKCGIAVTDIAVLTFYSLQQFKLQAELKGSSWGNGIVVSTVDGFQGGECAITLVSMVRTSRNVGFLNQPKRINVITTRAKEARWIFGNRQKLSGCDGKDVRALMDGHGGLRVVGENEFNRKVGTSSVNTELN